MLFPEEEYAERLGRLRAVMEARGVAMVIVDEPEMLHYFTGFAVSENLYRAAVIPADGMPTMIVRLLDEQPFLAAAWFDQRRAFDDLEDPVAIVADVIGAADCVGLDMNSYCMPAKRFQHLAALLPGARFVDFSDTFRPLRLNKSPREVAVLRQAAGIADEAMRRAIAAAVPGTTSRTAAAVASSSFIELGADFGRSGPITVGRGWNFLHARISDDTLQPGDVLHLELVPKVNGYCAKLMRPAVMGPPPAELSEAAAALIELQDRQIAAMVPGAGARSMRVCAMIMLTTPATRWVTISNRAHVPATSPGCSRTVPNGGWKRAWYFTCTPRLPPELPSVKPCWLLTTGRNA